MHLEAGKNHQVRAVYPGSDAIVQRLYSFQQTEIRSIDRSDSTPVPLRVSLATGSMEGKTIH